VAAAPLSGDLAVVKQAINLMREANPAKQPASKNRSTIQRPGRSSNG
jgi:hypothetical protein